MVDGDRGAVHDEIVIPHQVGGLVGLENVGLDKVNSVVIQPGDNFASPGFVRIPDGDPGGVAGLKEIENRFAADFPGGTEAKYFHWGTVMRPPLAAWPRLVSGNDEDKRKDF